MIGQSIGNAAGPRIAVVGVGGAGCNVVSSFMDECCPVDTISINTDKEALHSCSADLKLYICKEVLHGEGARGDTTLGKRCADIHMDEIREAVSGYDAVFVVAGLGGGTGTGAMSVVLDAAQSQGVMTFAVAISPFTMEGRRKDVAREGWSHIKAVCENSILVDNDKVLLRMADLTVAQAFGEVNRSIRAHVMGCIAGLNDRFRDTRIRPSEVGVETDAGCDHPIQTLMSA